MFLCNDVGVTLIIFHFSLLFYFCEAFIWHHVCIYSAVSNACDLPRSQAEFVKKLLHFEARRKTEEELDTKVTFRCVTYIRTRVC